MSVTKQAFIVGKRKLRSQKYLIATGAKSVIHPKYNLDQVNCLTIDDFWQNNSLVNLPNKIAIIGNSAKSLALAQGLTNLNKKINLVIPETRILPQEDSDLARLIQAQLTADGIEIFTHANIIKIFQNQNNKIIQLGDRIIETESIIFTDDYKANISGLNLQGVGIDFRDSEIIVDHKFQTTNKDIYACGNVIGDIKSSVIVSQEVNIAIKNMLFISWFNKSRFNDNCLPKVIFTQPNIARLGINKTEAIRLYGKNIYVIKEYFKTISQAQISGNTTGWCEMIFRPNGQIIGCTIIGDRANELISTIAVMMQYKIKLNRNPQSQLLQVKISSISPSLAEIVQRVATSFYLQKLQRDRRLIRRLEDWFSFRRNWNL